MLDGDEVLVAKRQYVLARYSRFIEAGVVRVDA